MLCEWYNFNWKTLHVNTCLWKLISSTFIIKSSVKKHLKFKNQNFELTLCVQDPLMLEQKQKLLKKGVNWLKKSGIKSLYNVLDDINLDAGVRMMDSCGYGILKPNIILVGYKNDWFNCADEEIQTYLNTIKYTFLISCAYKYTFLCNNCIILY